jgi:hypothetical protein
LNGDRKINRRCLVETQQTPLRILTVIGNVSKWANQIEFCILELRMHYLHFRAAKFWSIDPSTYVKRHEQTMKSVYLPYKKKDIQKTSFGRLFGRLFHVFFNSTVCLFLYYNFQKKDTENFGVGYF